MGTQNSHGFTIIETMLFLAVSGLLIMGMIVGTGASLNIQRYRDATETFKATVQQQYADLRDVQNGRSADWVCGTNAQPVQTGDATKLGQGDCVLAGKLMHVQDDRAYIYRVIAYQTSDALRADDIQSMRQNYRFAVSQTEVEERTLEWGVKIAWPKSGAGANTTAATRSINMLFLRSPHSGSLYTFTNDTTIANKRSVPASLITTLLTPGDAVPGQGSRTICMNSSGLFGQHDRAIFLSSYASSGSAVEVRTNEMMRTLGGSGASQC